MKSNKDIRQHLDQLMNEAENPDKIMTRSGFEDRLFAGFDAIDSSQKKNPATIFTLSEVRKYAAIILILILNISAVLFYTSDTESDQTIEDISQYSSEYFPDYATLTFLE